ncbi:MAG: BREX system P-loop protein BrxC, partial [Bacillota bacterium]
MSPAGTIESLFARDIRRRIEEVIKLHQTDEAVVAEELDEYVATPAIRNAYLRVLERYVETPLKPHEGIGVWVSGFFGSGKSSFAKYLGLALADRPILGISAADRLADRLADDRVRVLLARARREIPTLVVPFDMAEDPLVRVGEEKITLVAYRALLRTLGYSDDPDLAELEITLEREGRLAEFERLYHETFGRPWVEGRANVAVAFGRASRIMHMLDPQTFPSADSWARGHKRADLGPRDLAERVLELVGRRCPQMRAVVFVADEVGQYIARSTEKMLD